MTTSTIFTVAKGACPTYNPEQPTYSPFQNLEEKRLKSACLASEELQRAYFSTANIAHAISLWYWAGRFWDYPILDHTTGPISKDEAVALLQRFCHRSREMALINLDRSKYAVAKNRLPGVSGAEVLKALDNIVTIMYGDEE